MAGATGFSSRRDQLWQVAVSLIEEELKTCELSQQEEEHGNRIQMKYHQLVSNLSCFGEITTQMYEKKKLTQKEFECIHDMQSTPIRANEELLSVIAKKPRDVYECFLTLLTTTNQLHLHKMLTSSNDNLKEPSGHKDLICSNFTWLTEKLDTENELIFLLYERNVLTFSEKEQIACKRGQFQKNVCLLEVLSLKSTENFEKFLSAMEETNQSHIVLKLKQTQGPCSRIPFISGQEKHNLPRSSSKPLPPPKPSSKSSIIQFRTIKLPLSSYCSDAINLKGKVKIGQIKKNLKRTESRLQTEISIKVIALRRRTLHGSEDMSETCFLHIVQAYRKLGNELTRVESDRHEKLSQLDIKTSQYSAAISVNDTLKRELRSMEEELESQKNLNQQNLRQQELIKEKLDKAQDEIFGLKMKCNSLKDENRFKEINMKQLELQLSRAEIDQQSTVDKMGMQTKVIQEKTLNETEEKLRLVEIEKEDLQKACNQLIEENQHLKKSEEQLLRGREAAEKVQAQLEISTLMLCASEKEHEILKQTIEEMKHNESRLQWKMQEEVDTEKRLRIEKETMLKEASDNLETAKRQLEVFQSDNKVNETTIIEKEYFPTRETLVVRNNHQFLIENLDSSRLIDLLHKKNCISDEDQERFNCQPGIFYKVDELVHWMRTITFKRDKRMIVLECLKEAKQNFIADLLMKGEVVVKANISSKLVSKFTLQKKLATEQAMTLQDKEKSVVSNLNGPQYFFDRRSSASGLQIISELLGDGLKIAPYCYREENGIIVWFWCFSQNTLRQLQEMYVSGVLLERMATLFKQLSSTTFSPSSTTAILVPQAITIRHEEFIKTIEIIDYKRDPVLLLTITTKAAEKDKAPIYGMTILLDEVFVVNQCSSCVEVYDVTSMDFKRSFVIDKLEEPRDIVSCSIKRYLYIVDNARPSQPMKILRVDANGNFLKKLWQDDDWGRLSVTKESNIILTVLEKHKILEITSDGQLILDITLVITSPWHAVKLASGHFMVSYGYACGGLCIVDTDGKIIICNDSYYKKLGIELIFPVNLVLVKAGSVLVVDGLGGRVLLMTSTLEFQRVLVSSKDGLKKPRRILLDEARGRMFIAQNTFLGNNGHICVFDIGSPIALQEQQSNT